MPFRPPKPCLQPGCPVLTDGRYCEAHAKSRPDHTRGSSAARGYDYVWQQFRAWFLRRHPLCSDPFKEGCHEAATDVHHRLAKAQGGEDSEENCQSLCHSCHSRVTAANSATATY